MSDNILLTLQELEGVPEERRGLAPEEQEKAREELRIAEANGFLYCRAVFVQGEFDSIWVKAHPTDDSKSWGRSEVYRQFLFRDGAIVKNPKWTPPAPKKEWMSHGLRCEVRDNRIGHHCGYVQIPEGHPWHQKKYNECLTPGCTAEWHYDCTLQAQVDVHGGVTFSGEGFSGGWWLGFDCAHLGDAASPEYRAKQHREYGYEFERDGHYWTIEEVAEETERMAAQIAEVTP